MSCARHIFFKKKFGVFYHIILNFQYYYIFLKGNILNAVFLILITHQLISVKLISIQLALTDYLKTSRLTHEKNNIV